METGFIITPAGHRNPALFCPRACVRDHMRARLLSWLWRLRP